MWSPFLFPPKILPSHLVLSSCGFFAKLMNPNPGHYNMQVCPPYVVGEACPGAAYRLWLSTAGQVEEGRQ